MKHALSAIGTAVLALMLLLSGSLSAASATSPSQPLAPGSPSAANIKDIEEYFTARMKELRIPGAALGITKDDKIVHIATYGQADGDRSVTGSTPFKIGSTSKSFTAVGVMQLVEQGKLNLDAPVQSYVPWFQAADAGASARITVRHLLNQTSGFNTAAGMSYMYHTDVAEDALEREVRASRDFELATEPGEKWAYSNRNYTTLGYLIQVVSGQSYEDYIADHVLAPLGMENTYMYFDEAKENDLAAGHQFWFGMPIKGGGLATNRAITPTGAISSSAEDMSKYLIAHLNGGKYGGGQVLSAEGVAQMHEGAVTTGSGSTKYGMGWIESTIGENPVSTHNGDTGDSHATMMVSPSTGYGVVVLMNGSNGQARLDIPAAGVMSMLMGTTAPDMPSEFGELVTIITLVLVAVLAMQLAALIRSVVLIRRWRRYPARRPGGKLRTLIRIGVPALISFVWVLVLVFVAPAFLSIPITAMSGLDFGWLIIASGTIALGWGVIVRPLLANRSVRFTPRKPDPFENSADLPVFHRQPM
ncbi:class A beta-lactamase-related serine hydrolase [Arthrobacter crusticola]|uniref:Class A beta-lactamase-related serine hydrolase n=1 Tax=Arthrobacter crusticola TaxID=2547960 RepID=A0A4R5TPB8_9MICC|nr:serine hydrolase domain-containing protein [Arthrobacter crusticola]TDK23928.1 class A beta-lactamase-related serine hydrolase [Arthrobacter crusticola]